MSNQLVLFYMFAVLVCLAAGMVVLSKNAVRSVLFLVCTFFAMCPLWLMLGAEFLSLSLIIVYVGAVMVLFIFVVMMLDIEREAMQWGFPKYFPVGVMLTIALSAGLIKIFNIEIFSYNFNNKINTLTKSNVIELGTLLYSRYLFAFEIAGIILLAAIVSAISLTFTKSLLRNKPRINNTAHVKKRDRVRLVSLHNGDQAT